MNEPALVRVLVCDDDEILGGAIVMLIDFAAGMEVVAPPVSDGLSAVAAVQTHHPDVVLIDVDLGGRMDGYETTRMIRSLELGTGVVIMSGTADVKKAGNDAVAAGGYDFLPKAEIPHRMLQMIRCAALR